LLVQFSFVQEGLKLQCTFLYDLLHRCKETKVQFTMIKSKLSVLYNSATIKMSNIDRQKISG
jgi:hypothetical protein